MQGISEGAEWTSRPAEESFGQGSQYSTSWPSASQCNGWRASFFFIFYFSTRRSLFWNSEPLNSLLGCFCSRHFEGSRQKGGLWSFSLPEEFLLLSLQTWVWLRLRYPGAPGTLLLMKLTGCLDAYVPLRSAFSQSEMLSVARLVVSSRFALHALSFLYFGRKWGEL